ncbi:hypothetical protein EDC04DRAFT_2891113 [Pisolithus marmoratus]|nr:hypothetical protein EDC04DRAFT_2891113 [Pisolithus marmoratus]
MTMGKFSENTEEDAVDSLEANAIQLIFAKMTIPVPRVHCMLKGEWDFLIVMDYIKGQTLAQLCHLKASLTMSPGPLSVQGLQRCESPIFGQVRARHGPFSSYSEFSTFFNERCKMALDAKGIPEDHPFEEVEV